MTETAGVEFFCYHRDRPGSMVLREELLEEHLSYMDRYQAEMIARGPTLTSDGGPVRRHRGAPMAIRRPGVMSGGLHRGCGSTKACLAAAGQAPGSRT